MWSRAEMGSRRKKEAQAVDWRCREGTASEKNDGIVQAKQPRSTLGEREAAPF